MRNRIVGAIAAALVLSGCATHNYLKKVKLISFVEDSTDGKSVGRRVGKDCAWKILGNEFGSASITRAIDKARRNATDLDEGTKPVDFMRNVSSEITQSNYILVTNFCYEVSGSGYMVKK